MKLKQIASALAIAAATLAAGSANAAFIIGATSFSGGFNQPGAFTNHPTSIVSGLTNFSIDPAALAIGSTGSFAGFVTGLANANSFDLTTPPQVLFTDGGFTFKLLSYSNIASIAMNCVTLQCTDGRSFNGVGEVTKAGFQATGFTMSWSAQGACNESAITAGTCGDAATGSWSASIAATGSNPPSIPEPGSVALVGLALAGLGLTARRRAAK